MTVYVCYGGPDHVWLIRESRDDLVRSILELYRDYPAAGSPQLERRIIGDFYGIRECDLEDLYARGSPFLAHLLETAEQRDAALHARMQRCLVDAAKRYVRGALDQSPEGGAQ